MSPILTRPVREQLEHDRVIRLLQARYKRKNEVIINPGNEQNESVTVENLVVFPDLLLFGDPGHKLVGTVEVETGESVNALEARAEWAVFCKLKLPLHLYVPPTSVDTARRLCAEYGIPVAEVWTFHTTFDQVRFTMIHRSPDAPVLKESKPSAKPKPGLQPAKAKLTPVVKAKPTATAKPAAQPVVKATSKPVAKPVVKAAAKAKEKPAAKAKPAKASKAVVKKAPLRQKPAAKPAAKKRR